MPITVTNADGTTSQLGSGDKYKLEFSTSDKFGAGTDAQVYVQFADAAGGTWTPTLTQTKAMFERRSVDAFVAGSLLQLQVGGWCSVSAVSVKTDPFSQHTVQHLGSVPTIGDSMLSIGREHAEPCIYWVCNGSKTLHFVLASMQFKFLHFPFPLHPYM